MLVHRILNNRTKYEILKYQPGNQSEKDYVCDECRKMGIFDEEINWLK